MQDIINIIEDMDQGEFYSLINEDLQEVVRATQQTGKKGKVTLAFEITTKGGFVTVVAECKPTVPRAAKAAGYFADEDGALHKSDPNQQELKFRKAKDLEGDAVEVKQAKLN